MGIGVIYAQLNFFATDFVEANLSQKLKLASISLAGTS
jgi:hypothetical protein